MQLSVQIDPIGDTTRREISAATQQVRDALERIPGVDRADPDRVAAPEHSKGGLVDALGGLVVSVAPTAIKAAFETLRASLAGQPPTKVLIKYKDTEVSFEFDPKKISLRELADAAERLRRAAGPG